MKNVNAVLSHDDIEVIFESLVNSEDASVSDSALTDVFMALAKMGVSVKIKGTKGCDCKSEGSFNSFDCEIRELANTIGDVLSEVGDLEKPEVEFDDLEENWVVSDDDDKDTYDDSEGEEYGESEDDWDEYEDEEYWDKDGDEDSWDEEEKEVWTVENTEDVWTTKE